MSNDQKNTIVTISGLSKKFNQKLALDAIDLDIKQGETLAILGPNGAGKTTLISLMLGRLKPSAGDVRILEHYPGHISLKRQCGALLQVSNLPDMSTVKEHIELFRSYYPQPMSYSELIKITGLNDIQDQYSKHLSGGQKQRLLFALAICGNPRLLFLDEPSVGMDIEARKALWSTIERLKKTGTSIVLTTHYLEEADHLADRIVMLNQGRIIQQGTSEAIKAKINGRKLRFISSASMNDLLPLSATGVIKTSGRYYEVHSTEPVKTLKELFEITDDISDLSVSSAALEDAFLLLNQQANSSSSVTGEL